MKLAILPRAVSALLLAASVLTGPLALAEEVRPIPVQSESELKKRAESLFAAFTKLGVKATFGAVEAGSTPDALTITNIEITIPQDKKITVERIEIRKYDWTDPEVPRFSDISIKRLVIPTDILGSEAARFGISKLTINTSGAHAFDDATKTVELSDNVLDVEELGELRVRLKFGEVTHADYKLLMDPARGPEHEAAAQRLLKATFIGGAISFKDKSLTERAIKFYASQEKITEEAAKAKLIESLEEKRKESTDDVEKELIDLAIRFLNRPGEFAVTAAPPAPVPVSGFAVMLVSLSAAKQALGLTFTVK